MGSGALEIDTRLEGVVARVRVGGEIDLATVNELIAAVEGVTPPGGVVELDLRGVAFMDSAGVAAVTRCRRIATGLDAGLVVRCAAEGPVAQLISWTGLDRVVDVRRDPPPGAPPEPAS